MSKKLKEEINFKEMQINLDNKKINENKILINETIDKLKEKEIFLDKELAKIKDIRKNIIQKKEINIEYKYIKKMNNEYRIEYKDKFNIIQNKNIKIDTKESENHILNKVTNTKLNLINNALLDNYLNTVNIGYNDYKDIFNESLEEINNMDNECEPIPSFLLCLHKNKDQK
jgi:hypothetical protein